MRKGPHDVDKYRFQYSQFLLGISINYLQVDFGTLGFAAHCCFSIKHLALTGVIMHNHTLP